MLHGSRKKILPRFFFRAKDIMESADSLAADKELELQVIPSVVAILKHRKSEVLAITRNDSV